VQTSAPGDDDFRPPDYNLDAAIRRELDREGTETDTRAVADRVARQIPDGSLRALIARELLPDRVAEQDGEP
jgi:hypothetical protein